MPEFGLPPSDEPFDFRHQARLYGRYRRDYSPALYEAIEARAGRADGRRALDVGCGTGFVTATLRRRGWQAVGADFSEPMLSEARRLPGEPLPLVRARGEALPVATGSVALYTSGTAFHWLQPAAAVAEVARVLAPGGWAAVFWRYAAPGEESMRLVADTLAGFGSLARVGADLAHELTRQRVLVHPATPLDGPGLVAEPPLILECELEFTAESFHGYIATLEWVRRLAGDEHEAFLARLREELERRHPDGFGERNEEYLFLARRT